MITISKENDRFTFHVKGMHKLWAFKSELSIPIDNVLRAYQDLDSIKGWKGWRAPGTHIPSIITSGTFHKEGNKIFWDVVNKEKSIIVELKDEFYQQLIIEVEDPKEAIELLMSKND